MDNKTSKPPILSISMLISGREEMKKSLDSLQYFKKAFPCEIILVDTGCNEEQRAFAENYADKIIDFEWCDDFSAARNAGLKETTGEWFLYLDDDEWFEEPKEIIEFFTSGEYKNYKSATYVVRNYRTESGAIFDESYPSRMAERGEDIRFIGKIHEFLSPCHLPKKAFSDFVHHYGYAYRNEEAARKHAKRNIKPLLKMRKEKPGDARWMLQLAQEYFALEEYEKTVEVCVESLEEWRKLKDRVEYAPAHVGGLYAYILLSLDNEKKYEEEEKWLKKVLEEPLLNLELMKPTVAFFQMAGARLYTCMGQYEESRKYLRRYLEYRTMLKDDRNAIEMGSAAIVSQVFQDVILYGAILICMESLIRLEDEQLAEEAFYILDWSDKRLLYQQEWEQKMTDACCRVPYRPLWRKIMQTLVSREGGMKEMYVVFLAVEMVYQKNGEEEQLLRLWRLVSELDYDHHYILYTKILWEAHRLKEGADRESGKDKIAGLFRKLFEKHLSSILSIRQGVWDIADDLEISMEDLLLEMDYRKWKDALEEWIRDAAIEDIQAWENRLMAWKRTEDIRYKLFTMKCMEGYLFRYSERETEISLWEDKLWKFADSVIDFYQPLFRENVFRDMPEVLPDDAWVALHLKQLQEHRAKGNDREALAALRKCIGVSPVHEKALEVYAEILKKEIQEKEQISKKAGQELEVLVKALKDTAKLRMERGEYQVAREILRQIKLCVPGDEEVEELLRKMERQM